MSAQKQAFLGRLLAVGILSVGVFFVNRHAKNYTYLLEGGNYPPPGRYGLQSRALLRRGSSHFIESCQVLYFFFISFKDPRGVCV